MAVDGWAETLGAPAKFIGVVAGDCDALFNTYCFILFFLPATLALYWAVPSRRWKLTFLTLASFAFYGLWDYRFIPLLLASSLFDFFAGQRIALLKERGGKAKPWLIASLIFNLGLLALFKYAIFFLDNARGVLALFGSSAQVPYLNIILPIGISFYTFQTISYTVDIYRGRVGPTRDFLKYLCYVTMFPQLVAGPIVRYSTMDEQLDDLPRRPSINLVSIGVTLFILGLAKKMLIADPIARFIDPLWDGGSIATLGVVEAWTISIGYCIQLYFDFSGYSDMAIGLGALLGFRYPINFNAPYQGINPADVWRRWHISLSTYIRDYLYIPLGGNRVAKHRFYLNTMFIMVIVGLWHGADWNQVLWGAAQGGVLVLYRATDTWWDSRPVFLQRAMTLWFWVLSLVIFRANTVGDSLVMLKAMLLPTSINLGFLLDPIVLYIVGAVVFALTVKPTSELRLKPTPARAVALATLFVISILFVGAAQSPFLYYQF